MIHVLALLILTQTPPAVRRTTPAADDLGMVVRQAGPLTISGTIPSGDGGIIGAVNQGVGLTDGGSWTVNCINCSASGGGWTPDGGSIGFLRMPDGGPLEVYSTNAAAGGPSYVNVLVDGGTITVNNFPALQAVTGPLTDAQLRATPVPISGTVTTTVAFDGGLVTALQGTSPWVVSDTPRAIASANNAGACVSVTTASTTVLASNASRKSYGFKASDDNTATVYCKLGATATTGFTSYAKGAAFYQDTGAVYSGVVDCISASGTQLVCPYEFN